MSSNALTVLYNHFYFQQIFNNVPETVNFRYGSYTTEIKPKKQSKKKPRKRSFLSFDSTEQYKLKAPRQPGQKFKPKNLTPYFFPSNGYVYFIRPYCKNILKVASITSEKNGKLITI